jgi:hypothetical protein
MKNYLVVIKQFYFFKCEKSFGGHQAIFHIIQMQEIT